MKRFVSVMMTSALLLLLPLGSGGGPATAQSSLVAYEKVLASFSVNVSGPAESPFPYSNRTYDEADRTPAEWHYPLSMSYTKVYPDPKYQDALYFVGEALVSGGSRDRAANIDVQVTTRSETDSNLSNAHTGLGANVAYTVWLGPRALPPPQTVIVFPFKVQAYGAAMVDVPVTGKGGTGAYCSLSIYDEGETSKYWSAMASSGTPTFAEFKVNETRWIKPLALGLESERFYFGVEMDAWATSDIAARTQGSWGAHAWVDPVLSFDQEAFDAMMGENTFRLADYFTVEFSTGVDPVGNTDPIGNSSPAKFNPAILLLLED